MNVRLHPATAIALLVTGATLSGCGATRGPAQTAPSPPLVTLTAQTARADANAEATHLLTVLQLPPSAHRVRAWPSGLGMPPLGTPMTTQLVDRAKNYVAPMSLDAVTAWFESHIPVGFEIAGRAWSGPMTAVQNYGFELDATSNPHYSWGSANLQVGLASRSSTSTAIQLDGIAEWINPAPLHDGFVGRRLRVTIQDGCPRTVRGFVDVINPSASDLKRHLLPAEAPTSGLTCTYGGVNVDPFRLVSSLPLTSTDAVAAAATIQAIPLGSHGTIVTSCPADFGSVTIDVFAYPARPDVDIWQDTSGCTSTHNGYIMAGFF